MMTTATQLQVSNVISVYSGRPGCCCGCKGTHYYPESMRDTAEARGGKVNDAMVKKVVKIVNEAMLRGKAEHESSHVFVDQGGRWYIAYLTTSK